MKRRVSFLLAMLMLVSLIGTEWTIADAIIPGEDTMTAEEKIYCNATLEDDFAPDRVLVVLTNAASTSLKTYSLADFTGYGFKSVTNLTSATTALANAKIQGKPIPEEFATNANVITFEDFYDVDLEKFNQILCLELKNPGKQNVLNAIKILEKHPDVKYAGPDYYMTLFSGETNDTYVDEQWALNMIDLPEAWEIAADSKVLVGIVDSAIDGEHPDLEGSMYVAPRDTKYEVINCMGADSEEPNHNGHGTMVAGIIAATINNGVGIAGACSNVNLVSLKVFNTDRDGCASFVITAINKAMNMGITILNFSGGFGVAEGSNDYTSLYAAIQNYSGLFICAAGNNSTNIDAPNATLRVVPAVYDLPNIITVAASTNGDRVWEGHDGYNDGTNYGPESVDLFAPGAEILSCYLRRVCSSSCHSDVHREIGYHVGSGSSFAAPYVTAVVAMIKTKYPGISNAQVIERLRLGVDKAYENGQNVYADFCKWEGRLNAYKALHDHNFVISTITVSLHQQLCGCGIVINAQHLFQTETLYLPGGQIQIIEICSVCGYQS